MLKKYRDTIFIYEDWKREWNEWDVFFTIVSTIPTSFPLVKAPIIFFFFYAVWSSIVVWPFKTSRYSIFAVGFIFSLGNRYYGARHVEYGRCCTYAILYFTTNISFKKNRDQLEVSMYNPGRWTGTHFIKPCDSVYRSVRVSFLRWQSCHAW